MMFIFGAKMQNDIEVGFHWYTASFPVKHLEEMCSAVGRALGKEWINLPGKRGFYLNNTVHFDDGARICHSADSESGLCFANHAVLDLSGEICAALSEGDIKLVLGTVRRVGGKATRIDAHVDLFDKPIDGKGICERYAATGHYTGPAWERSIIGHNGGVTAQFGKRGRDGGLLSVICYDKNIESGGVRDCFRVEACFQKVKADELQNVMASCWEKDSVSSILGKAVAGSICFYDKWSDKNSSRREVAAWWARVMERLRSGKNYPDTS